MLLKWWITRFHVACDHCSSCRQNPVQRNKLIRDFSCILPPNPTPLPPLRRSYILWTVHARVLKFHLWSPHGKLADPYYFLSELSPFLELCTFEKNRMKSDAYHILWTVHARVLKFHIWIPHGKIADPYFFPVRFTSLSRVMLLWKNLTEILLARYLENCLS